MARPVQPTSQSASLSGVPTVGCEKDFKLPYRMTAEYGNARFGELYEKALLRKKLFKEYMLRNQVLERLNQAIEVHAKFSLHDLIARAKLKDLLQTDSDNDWIWMQALYDCEVLPEQPLEFIAAHIKSPPVQQPTATATANTPTVRPAPAFIITGPGSMSQQQPQGTGLGPKPGM